MASTSSEMLEFPTAKTVPVPDATPPQSHISFRDMVRIALFFTIPIYARIYLFSSMSVAFGHVFVIGSTGICITHLSRGTIGLHSVWDIIYGLLVSSFPSWSTSIIRIAWVGSKVDGWRWEVVYWTFVARRLAYLLPEYYGSDVEALVKEYKHAYPIFQRYVGMISWAVLYFALWPKGCPWHDVLLMSAIIGSFIEYVYLTFLNYVHLQKYGKTVRQDSWPHRDMYTRKWAFDERGNPIRINHTFEEWINFLATGNIRGKIGARK